ncbi:nucleoplasmin-like protein [Phlebotomus argentipes]|uniref:nucleoplasmin-like protein n=1 Tax=Phlebotomus argentipes TaxID=94469 RepID=UPI002892E067|nr:nucleoplasmin-like protein [Phlebotomus argentipes]
MSDEYFFGITLTSEKNTHTWDPYSNIDDAEMVVPNKLLIKQILLDVTAKEGEYHVVEVTAPTCMDEVKIPIAVLKVGELRSVSMELEFPDAPVTFKLVQGQSPVHILGHHLIGESSEEEEEIWEADYSSGDEEGENAEDDEEAAARKKKKLTNNLKAGGTKGAVKAKKK